MLDGSLVWCGGFSHVTSHSVVTVKAVPSLKGAADPNGLGRFLDGNDASWLWISVHDMSHSK